MAFGERHMKIKLPKKQKYKILKVKRVYTFYELEEDKPPTKKEILSPFHQDIFTKLKKKRRVRK